MCSSDLPAGTGDLAEAAVWNVALTDAEVAALARGIHPFLIRPDALVAYWPILGRYSPEINLKSNSATMAIQGTLSQAAHPRIFRPPQFRGRRLRSAGTAYNQSCLAATSPNAVLVRSTAKPARASDAAMAALARDMAKPAWATDAAVAKLVRDMAKAVAANETAAPGLARQTNRPLPATDSDRKSTRLNSSH